MITDGWWKVERNSLLSTFNFVLQIIEQGTGIGGSSENEICLAHVRYTKVHIDKYLNFMLKKQYTKTAYTFKSYFYFARPINMEIFRQEMLRNNFYSELQIIEQGAFSVTLNNIFLDLNWWVIESFEENFQLCNYNLLN